MCKYMKCSNLAKFNLVSRDKLISYATDTSPIYSIPGNRKCMIRLPEFEGIENDEEELMFWYGYHQDQGQPSAILA